MLLANFAGNLLLEAPPVNRIRERVKEQLPAVLLTLLSIVQALALELLWTGISDADELYHVTWTAAIQWAQMAADFLGIVVIWVVYASTAMRFRWLPSTGDSVYPFVIGVGELVLIASSRPEQLGAWFLDMAFVFAMMHWVAHHTLRRSRADPENAEFFDHVPPATVRDFYPAIATVAGLCALGGCFYGFDVPASLGLAGAVLMNLLLLWQLNNAHVFWERTMRDEEWSSWRR